MYTSRGEEEKLKMNGSNQSNMNHSHHPQQSQQIILQHQQSQPQSQQAANQQPHQQDPRHANEMTVFKRQQHSTKLSQELNNMLRCNTLLDVTIYCDDGQVSAHKLVLAASSIYFRNLFKRMTDTFHYPAIVLREIPIDDLKTIIDFIYDGEISVPRSRVSSLLRCANYLQIEGMDSSTNSLNAILASSSIAPNPASSMIAAAVNMSHPLLQGGPINTNPTKVLNNITGPSIQMNSSNMSGGISTQFPPQSNNNISSHTSSRTSRGQSSRNNHTNNMHNINIKQSGTSNRARHGCPVCLKTFTHGFTLKRHMKLHSQGRSTIYCDVCSKSYSCKDSYLRHKKSSGHLQHADFHQRSVSLNIGTNR